MSNHAQTYEVKVEVKRQGSEHFSSHVGMYIEDKTTKMFHFDTRTSEQATRKGEKHGRVISVRKANVERLRGDAGSIMAKLQLANPYPDAIAMDEMIWCRKNKRDERIQNREKYRNGA